MGDGEYVFHFVLPADPIEAAAQVALEMLLTVAAASQAAASQAAAGSGSREGSPADEKAHAEWEQKSALALVSFQKKPLL